MLYNIYSPSAQMYISQSSKSGDLDLCARAKDSKLVFLNLEIAKNHLGRLFFSHMDQFHDLILVVRDSQNDIPRPVEEDVLPDRNEAYFHHQVRSIVDCKHLRLQLEVFNIFWTIEDRVTFNNLIELGDMLVTFNVDLNQIQTAMMQLHQSGELSEFEGEFGTTAFINRVVDLAFSDLMTNWNLASHRLANVCIVRPENQMLFKLGMHSECKTFMITREPRKIFN